MKNAKEHLVAAFVGLSLASLVAFLITVVWQTLAPSTSPLVFESGDISAYPSGDNTVIVYLRPFVARGNGPVSLERSIACNISGGEQVHDLPSFTRTYKTNERVAQQRVILHPVKLEANTQCHLHTSVRWSPNFAWTWKLEELPPMPFAVEAK